MGYKLLDTLSTLCMFNRDRGNFDGVIKVFGQGGATTSATQLRTSTVHTVLYIPKSTLPLGRMISTHHS